MVKDKSTLTNEVVKEQYEEMISRGLPFLQIFPEMIQESNVAETFRTRTNERNKSLTQDNLDYPVLSKIKYIYYYKYIIFTIIHK